MTNPEIAAAFERVADLLEFQGENPFRVRAYRQAARRIDGMVESLTSIRQDPKQKLTDLEGIGADLASKIATLLDTGGLPLLDELAAAVPAAAFAIMRVPGLGPKKAKLLVDGLGIDSLDALEAACREGRVQDIKGFGEKTEAAILENIAFAKSPEHERLLWCDAETIADAAINHLKADPGCRKIEPAGSLRRGRQTVGDLDIVVVADEASAIMDRLAGWEGTTAVLLRGETKMSVHGPQGVQIDLRVVPPGSFGAALQYFTGSKEHNVQLRSRARDRGLTMNEYGVFQLDKNGEPHRSPVAGDTEEGVYEAVGLPWIPPELREGRGEIAIAERGELPDLISVRDIRGDLHMHTTATDGENTLAEMARAAIERGLSYIAITDHGKRVTMAGGLDRKRLLAQWDQIDRFNESLQTAACADGCKHPKLVVLKGIEVDMLEKEGLDLPDEVLARADWVVASLHYGQNQPRDRITARILEAIENPHVSVIGHPTGRLINRRPAYDVDIEQVIDAAARTGTFLEINANPIRLDLDDIHAAAARIAGVKIVISTDAHSTRGFDVLRYGVLQARRAGLTANDVANTRTLAGLRKLLAAAPKRKSATNA